MKTIYFVRHGEAQANIDGLLAGAKTDSPLTVKGEAQAHDLAATLASKPVDLIVASPLIRAMKTAEIIAGQLGYQQAIQANALFIERDFGSATNMPKPQAYAMLDDGRITDAESIEAFGKRAEQALAWLRTLSAEHILVVSHSAFGQMLGTIAQGGEAADFLKFPHLANAGTFEFELS